MIVLIHYSVDFLSYKDLCFDRNNNNNNKNCKTWAWVSTLYWNIICEKQCCIRINELTWGRKGEFNSEDHCIYFCGQDYLRRNGVAVIDNKRIQSAISSAQFSCSVMPDSLWPHELQHPRPLCPSPVPGTYPNSCPWSQRCHPTISSSVVRFSSCPQSFLASESFRMSQLFASGGKSIAVSASASVLQINTQDWFPLGWTGCISLQSKGLSRVYSSTTVQKNQFFGARLSL